MREVDFFVSGCSQCASCNHTVVDAGVDFWHRPGCRTPRAEPTRTAGWFYWVQDGESDPAGPFATEQVAREMVALALQPARTA